MSLKERLILRVHGVICQTGKVPQADWGCCGCNASEADAYITVDCDFCKAPGDSYCWSCVDGPGWYDHITPASFTAIPGRER